MDYYGNYLALEKVYKELKAEKVDLLRRLREFAELFGEIGCPECQAIMLEIFPEFTPPADAPCKLTPTQKLGREVTGEDYGDCICPDCGEKRNE